jgi:hypothetical protein
MGLDKKQMQNLTKISSVKLKLPQGLVGQEDKQH